MSNTLLQAGRTQRKNARWGKPDLIDSEGREFRVPSEEYMALFEDGNLKGKRIFDMRLPRRVPRENRLEAPQMNVQKTFFLPNVIKDDPAVILPQARGVIVECYKSRHSNVGLVVVDEWLWIGKQEDEPATNIKPHGRSLTPRV